MVNTDAVPETMRTRDCWVCWRYGCRECNLTYEQGVEYCAECGSEVSKIPLSPEGGYNASTTDSDTWGSFDAATEAHTDDGFETHGIGFSFDEDDVLAGFDLDDVRDPESEEMEEWARDVMERLDSYTEVSPSGTGYHIYVLGIHPGDKSKVNQESTLERFEESELELYDSARYFTVTGDRVDELSHDVERRNGVVQDIYSEYMADDEEDESEGSDVDAPVIDMDDDDIIETAKNAKNGDKFERLWEGSTSGYESHSEAQMALANMLAFYTGGDQSQMLDLFEQSGMKRDEDDVRKFTNYDAPKAVKSRTEFYDPKNSSPKSTATDGGATAEQPAENRDERTRVGLQPTDVRVYAGLGEDDAISDLDDRERAAVVWDLIKTTDEVHVRVRRDNGSLWAYDGGVWKPQGERALRHAGRKALTGKNYGQNVLRELKAQARSDPTVEVEADDMGLEPGMVAVENGLLYLDAAAGDGGENAIRELEPEDYALAQLPVRYDPDADYTEWNEYVQEWAESGRAKALQEYVGYCLHVGDMPIHRALLLVGSGANGKGTFLSVVRKLLGRDNTSSIELQTLANERDAVADFYGSMANIDDDLSARKLGNGLGMFKKLVGGDRVRARRLYEDGFEFDATGKHLYAANEVPDVKIPDDDEAFWRRWLLVEFPNHYPPSERDPGLRDRLTEQQALSGVLNWAIEGWRRLLEQNHFTNEEQYAHAKRDRWQAWGDSIDQFVNDCVERDTDAENISTSAAHRRYAAWCRENGEKPASQQKLTSTLKAENVDYAQSVRIDGSVQRGYKALGLSDEVPELQSISDQDSRDDPQQQSLTE